MYQISYLNRFEAYSPNVVQDTAAKNSLCGKPRPMNVLLLSMQVVRHDDRVMFLISCHHELVVKEVLRTPSLAAAG